MNIVTDVTISDPDNISTEAIYIQISTGYNDSQDILTLTGSHPTINSDWNLATGRLTLTSSTPDILVTYVDFIKAIKDVLQETPPELASDIMDYGIIMTGGSSQLRQMPELVYRRTGVIAKLANDPYYCVARGTGIALKHLDTYQKSILAKQ